MHGTRSRRRRQGPLPRAPRSDGLSAAAGPALRDRASPPLHPVPPPRLPDRSGRRPGRRRRLVRRPAGGRASAWCAPRRRRAPATRALVATPPSLGRRGRRARSPPHSAPAGRPRRPQARTAVAARLAMGAMPRVGGARSRPLTSRPLIVPPDVAPDLRRGPAGGTGRTAPRETTYRGDRPPLGPASSARPDRRGRRAGDRGDDARRPSPPSAARPARITVAVPVGSPPLRRARRRS